MTHAFTAETVFASLRKGATLEPVAPEVEADIIRAAQAGDEAATYHLIALYAPAARNALARFSEALDREDAEQEVLLSFLGLIASHDADKSPRLAGRVIESFRRDLVAAANAASGGWSIPSRTLDRFYGILRRAEGDLAKGAEMAPAHEMPAETFLNIANVLRGTVSLDGRSGDGDTTVRVTDGGTAEADGWGSTSVQIVGAREANPFADIEDRLAVQVAMSALDERETAITRFAYGFDAVVIDGDVLSPEGHAPLADTYVATATGLTRPTVQRTRAAALGKMRAALALDEEVSA